MANLSEADRHNRAFGARMAIARKAKGYASQPPFARALGVTIDAYKRYERGERTFPAELLELLMELTDKDANYFFPRKHAAVRKTGT